MNVYPKLAFYLVIYMCTFKQFEAMPTFGNGNFVTQTIARTPFVMEALTRKSGVLDFFRNFVTGLKSVFTRKG